MYVYVHFSAVYTYFSIVRLKWGVPSIRMQFLRLGELHKKKLPTSELAMASEVFPYLDTWWSGELDCLFREFQSVRKFFSLSLL